MSFEIIKKNINIIFGIAGLFIFAYLFYSTGLHGDDMAVISQYSGRDLMSFLSMDGANIELMGLPSYYLFNWAYAFIGGEIKWGYDLIKGFSTLLSIAFVYRFAFDYMPRDRAILVSLLFVFNPVHETTLYWYLTIVYVLTPSIIMLSHHYVRKEKYGVGFLIGSLGSFMWYVSPPYGIGLAVIFLLEKSYKKTAIFILPALLYIAYYFTVSAIQPSAEHRISHSMTMGHLMKNYLLEIPAFFDSLIGPSFWLKVYYSIASIEFLSMALAVLIIVFMIKNARFEQCKISASLLGGLAAVCLLSFGMFAISDIMGHRAFNLGNRLAVYGSLLIAFLAASIPSNRILLPIVAIFFVMPTFGLSDHWKSWNASQIQIIDNVRNNQDLKKLTKSDTLLVADNMYSKLGPFSHIEFFNMPWNVNAIFKPVVKYKNIIPLNSYIYFKDQRLIDDKSFVNIEVKKDLYLYKSGNDKLIKISPEQLPEILANRPREIRHWVQFFKDTWIETAITSLSPRLSFLFEKF
jgi:hypothetical protein